MATKDPNRKTVKPKTEQSKPPKQEPDGESLESVLNRLLPPGPDIEALTVAIERLTEQVEKLAERNNVSVASQSSNFANETALGILPDFKTTGTSLNRKVT